MNDDRWKPVLKFAGDWALDLPDTRDEMANLAWCDESGPHEIQLPAWLVKKLVDQVGAQ